MFLMRRQTLARLAMALWAMFGVIQQAKADSTALRSQSVLDVTEGSRIARTLCVNCHMVDASGPAIGSDRLLSFSWIANQKGLTSATLPAWLSTSHPRMPDFNLTRDEIRQVSAYILSLRK